jgi:hypothetical protein
MLIGILSVLKLLLTGALFPYFPGLVNVRRCLSLSANTDWHNPIMADRHKSVMAATVEADGESVHAAADFPAATVQNMSVGGKCAPAVEVRP